MEAYDCGNTVATFKFYSCNNDNVSPHYIVLFSNLGDLKDQLYYFCVQPIYLLRKIDYVIKTIKLINILCNYI